MNVSLPYDYQPMPERTDLLVVFAHPDDEVDCFGGLIPHSLAEGKTVLAVCMTRGEGGGNATRRDRELRASLWTCGLRHEPIQGAFADCGYVAQGQFKSLAWVWNQWGGRARAAAFVADLYRRYRPTVIFTHNPVTGDYGHPNHMATGWACIDAYETCLATADLADDETALQQLHIASRSDRAWRMDWDQPDPRLNGKSATQIATRALACHQSQTVGSQGVRPGLAFELALFRTAHQPARHAFFEHDVPPENATGFLQHK